jgi:signal transduction histidine kinase
MAGRQVRQLVRLVDDLLDVSRITGGKIALRKERVALGDVVARAIETTRSVIESRGHDLTVSLPPEPVGLDADPARLAQVVANLLSNAAKYTPPGGRIWLTAEAAGDELVIRVRDTGAGLPPELVPNVFDLFVQGDMSLDRTRGGLGIGLTIVRRLVELHGGRVEARSFRHRPGQRVRRPPPGGADCRAHDARRDAGVPRRRASARRPRRRGQRGRGRGARDGSSVSGATTCTSRTTPRPRSRPRSGTRPTSCSPTSASPA